MKVEIQNFKSIVDLKIQIKDHLKYFVGKNESGKSNILDAFREIKHSEKLFKNAKNFNNDDDWEICAQYHLINSTVKKWNNLIGLKNKNFVIKIIKKEKEKEIQSAIISKEFQNHILDFLSKYFVIKNEIPIFNIKTINSLIPINIKNNNLNNLKSELIALIKESVNINNHVQIVDDKNFKQIKDQYSFEEAKKDSTFMSLWNLLGHSEKDINILISNNPTSNIFIDKKTDLNVKNKKEFNSFIKDFWNQKTIMFEIKISDKQFIIRAADQFKDEVTPFRSTSVRSEGMKHYLTQVLFLNSINDNGKQVIILMDEPDRTLHPNAVFDLKKYIEKLSFIKKYFFIIATHNTFFIDKNNFHQINYVAKESSSQGTVIINHFAKKSTKEERSTFSPFIYQLGIDRESFLSLKKKIVFVEGLHDYFLFNSLYNLLKKNDNELMFIPLYGADKKSSLIPLVISINNRLPYFIFDYDEAGNKALQELKQENFVVGKMQNFTFINNLNSFKKQDKNHVVEDLFEGIEDQNHKTLKDFSKRTKQYIEFAKNIENQTIVIPEENMKKIKKLFNKIQKYFKNIS